MVWFHGGAYLSGSGEAPKYDPDALVTEGRVVVVTVSYRLGIFGYLNPTAHAEGNLGLRDQILALGWTRQNIAAFGGDPTRITIFGQSAGGDAVMSLIVCDEASGLFQRAILQSAPLGLRSGREAMTAEMRAAATAALNGIAPTEASVEQLLDAQTAAVATAQRFGALGGFPFAPIAGMDPLPPARDMSRHLAYAALRVEILVGYTRNDAAPFVGMDPRARRLQRRGRVGKAVTRLLGKTMTGRIFGRPAVDLARFWTASGGKATAFRVDWSPPGAPLGACHCIDLPLLLGSPETWADAPMLGPATHPIDNELARKVRDYWAGFAHKGTAALGGSSLQIR
jgi:para-nitrobenzyl esterase